MSETHPASEPAAPATPHVTPDIAPVVPPAEPPPATHAPTPAPTPAAATAGSAEPAPSPGATLANPAQPLAPTVVPAPAPKATFIQKVEGFFGFPKTKYHPVHGAVTVTDPNEEASLAGPATDWFDTPELADKSRTWTEAHMAGAANTRAKLAALDAAGLPIVRNSAAAHEAIRKGTPEPL